MSRSVRRTTVIPVALVMLAAGAAARAQDSAPLAPVDDMRPAGPAEPAPRPIDRSGTAPALELGPIAGLTTAWHPAPPETCVARGMQVQFRQQVPDQWTIRWEGATPHGQPVDGVAVATTSFPVLGAHDVRAVLNDGYGDVQTNRCSVTVVDMDLSSLRLGDVRAWGEPMRIDESRSETEVNDETMAYFFGPSIAEVTDLGGGRCRTSVERLIDVTVAVDPPGFAPLVEWRVDGVATTLGASGRQQVRTPGVHVIEAGPPGAAPHLEVEAYRVTITSVLPRTDLVFDGLPYVFMAETDPKGYEQDITWLASTKYGSARPVTGRGPGFVTMFTDTWGPGVRWLGVKADQGLFNQDQKNPFGDPLEFLAVNEVIKLEAGDLDNDGFLDLVALIPGSIPSADGRIQVFMNNGNNAMGLWTGFSAQPPIAVGPAPTDLVVRRLDDDILPDVAITEDGTPGRVRLWLTSLGGGGGIFPTECCFTVGNGPIAIVAHDYTRNGRNDLAVAHVGDDTVVLYENQNAANCTCIGGLSPLEPVGSAFPERQSMPLQNGSDPREMTTDDLDNDKDLHDFEIATANRGTDELSILEYVLPSPSAEAPLGPAVFGARDDVTVMAVDPVDLAVGFFNADLNKDLVSANRGDNSVSIVRSDGNHTYTFERKIGVGLQPRSIDVAPLDGNANDDIVIAADDPMIGPAVQVLFRTPTDFMFTPPVAYDVGANPNVVRAIDVNNDGRIDIVTGNADNGPTGGSVSVLLNLP